MHNIRFKLLELAIQGGATIENAVRVARDFENYVVDDPLRLDTPCCKKNRCSGGCTAVKEVEKTVQS